MYIVQGEFNKSKIFPVNVVRGGYRGGAAGPSHLSDGIQGA